MNSEHGKIDKIPITVSQFFISYAISKYYYIKSRAKILTQVQSKAYMEPSSSSSLFNLPYSKDIHYFSQARHIAHSTTQGRKLYASHIVLNTSYSITQESNDIHYFIQARHTQLTPQLSVESYIYTLHNCGIFPYVFEEHRSLELRKLLQKQKLVIDIIQFYFSKLIFTHFLTKLVEKQT